MDDQVKEKAQQATQQEIQLYGKLKELSKTNEFKDYTDWLIKQTAGSIMKPYYGKDAPSYEEFLEAWGVVRGKLLVLQEVGGAEAIQQQLAKQLKEFNNPQNLT